MRSVIAIGVIVSAGLACAARGDVLAHWTFETSKPTNAGPFAAELGVNALTSFASGFHGNGAAVYSSPVGNGSPHSFSSNTWTAGDYYQFTTSTVGYRDITFGWDQTRSSTGPSLFDLSWSADGVNFTVINDDYTVILNDPNFGGPWNQNTYKPMYTFAPEAPPVPKDWVNKPTLYFRITASTDGTQAAGTGRVDDVIVSGNVPSPGSAALLGIAGLTAARRRR